MKRAIGIVRVSQVKGREGDSFASPAVQLERIQDACKRDGLRLVETHDELDVSGGKSLVDRPGLSQAIDAIEHGRADVVVAAYFDRLFRSLSTQAEVIERVEAAGGQVLAVDVGRVSNDSAAHWLSGTMHGTMAEYYRRSVRERSAEALARAVARGVPPWHRVPLGYRKRADATYEPDPVTAPIARRVFAMRAAGESISAIHAMLISEGIERGWSGTQRMMASRVYIGEIHFGNLVNLHAHEAIVSRDVWAAVQRMRVSRGRKAKSERLLARLGVLVCGSCGARLCVMGGGKDNRYPAYRCAHHNPCPKHTIISASVAEQVVSSAVRTALQDAHGRASMAETAQEAASALARAQDDLDAALRVFSLTGAENEAAAVERIAELRQGRDDAQGQVDRIGPEAARTVNAAADWDHLTLGERRDLIRATVASATVAPFGRGAGRVAVELFG